ncbi:hypothetical protein L1O48_05795 [Ligilactobacillus equi]|uniref:hypothetical protein n=1 Tax=Ligilactobacillus equi TaxID=137357 RepID=UPI002ED18ECF
MPIGKEWGAPIPNLVEDGLITPQTEETYFQDKSELHALSLVEELLQYGAWSQKKIQKLTLEMDNQQQLVINSNAVYDFRYLDYRAQATDCFSCGKLALILKESTNLPLLAVKRIRVKHLDYVEDFIPLVSTDRFFTEKIDNCIVIGWR